MALLGVIAAFLVFKIFSGILKNPAGRNISIFLAAWASVFAASTMAAVELSISGTVPFSVAFPAMAGWHAIIGTGEGIITVVAVNFVNKLGFADEKTNISSEVK